MKAVVFANPYATNAESREMRIQEALEAFDVSKRNVTLIEEKARPDHLDIIANDRSSSNHLVISDGGDATTGLVIGAIAGIVPNDLRSTARNLEKHKEIATRTIFFANAGGNANMWATSANGKSSKKPSLLRDYDIKDHRPIHYGIFNEFGDCFSSGSVSSCMGLGATAKVAEAINRAKPVLNELNGLRRLKEEVEIAVQETTSSPPIDISIDGRPKNAQIGIEFIGTSNYAKVARTSVDAGDTRWQTLTANYSSCSLLRMLYVAGTTIQGVTGLYKDPVIDLENDNVEVVLESPEPTPFHADGEYGVNMLQGQTLVVALANVAVPIVVSKK